MKYAELDTAAKEHAYNKWNEGEMHHDWWDSTYEDAIACAACLGIEIGTNTRRSHNGKSYETPDISFSGFWSQGDGCSFGGQLLVAGLAGAAEKIKEYAGADETLHALGVRAEALYGQFATLIMVDRLSDGVELLYPEFSLDMCITIEGKNHHGYSTRIVYNDGIESELEKACDSFVEDFASWIYDQLEKEHDHLTSEASFKEWVESNEPDFDEDGDLE